MIQAVIIYYMKTIAITIDEDTLQRIDRLLEINPSVARNRSDVIRQAVREFVVRVERLTEEEHEREIFRQHRQRLARQADALVKEQAK
jgi:metal-responsive CopG/Arc/MetJ family transcriptional regulator